MQSRLLIVLTFWVLTVSGWQMPSDLPDGVYRVELHDDVPGMRLGNRSQPLGKRAERYTITRLGDTPTLHRRGKNAWPGSIEFHHEIIEIVNIKPTKLKDFHKESRMRMFTRVGEWKKWIDGKKLLAKDMDDYGLLVKEKSSEFETIDKFKPQSLSELYGYVKWWLSEAGPALGFARPTFYNKHVDGPQVDSDVPASLPLRPDDLDQYSGYPNGYEEEGPSSDQHVPLLLPTEEILKGMKPGLTGRETPFRLAYYDCDYSVPRLAKREYAEAREGLMKYCDDFMVPTYSRHIALSVKGNVAVYVCNSAKHPMFCTRKVWDWLEKTMFDFFCDPYVASWVHSDTTQMGYGRGWSKMKMCVDRDLTSMTWIGDLMDPIRNAQAQKDREEDQEKIEEELAGQKGDDWVELNAEEEKLAKQILAQAKEKAKGN